MGQGEQQERTPKPHPERSSPEELEEQVPDLSQALADIMASNAEYAARPWYRKLADRFSPSILFFLDVFKPLVGIVVLVLAVFAWTNWYFSPERRLMRFVEEMNRAVGASEEIDKAALAMWESPLRPRAGGGFAQSHCGSLGCQVSLTRLYYRDVGHITFRVIVHLRPEFTELGKTTLLPPDVRWKPTLWRWEVSVAPKDRMEYRDETHYDGNMGDLARLHQVLGTSAAAGYISAMARRMEVFLARQREPEKQP